MVSLSLEILLFVCSLLVVYKGVDGRIQSLYIEDNIELEKQLKLLNKPAIKTIRTKYGDIYDCVDFYKQAASGHPLLKNHTLEFQKDTTPLRTKLNDGVVSEVNPGLKDGGCPLGTIPIQRIKKEDLIRQRFAHKRADLANDNSNGGSDYAVCGTKGQPRIFKGASAKVALYNPTVTSQQFSTARLKLSNGLETIEAGWRVDPILYGDNQTRLYIRTDAGTIHCFNTQCPGFVITNTDIPLDLVLGGSTPPEHIYVVGISIVYDPIEGNWVLLIGKDNVQVGYWPNTLLKNPNLPNYVEWGGEAFSPDTTKPRMGTGSFVKESTAKDAYFARAKLITERGQTADADELHCISTPKFYEALDEGHVDNFFEHLILYGGPGTNE